MNNYKLAVVCNWGPCMVSTEWLLGVQLKESVSMTSAALQCWELELVVVDQWSETGSSASDTSNMLSNTWELFARPQKTISLEAIINIPAKHHPVICNTQTACTCAVVSYACQHTSRCYYLNSSSLTYRHPLLLLLAWPQTLALRHYSHLPAIVLSALFLCLVLSAIRVGGYNSMWVNII